MYFFTAINLDCLLNSLKLCTFLTTMLCTSPWCIKFLQKCINHSQRSVYVSFIKVHFTNNSFSLQCSILSSHFRSVSTPTTTPSKKAKELLKFTIAKVSARFQKLVEPFQQRGIPPFYSWKFPIKMWFALRERLICQLYSNPFAELSWRAFVFLLAISLTSERNAASGQIMDFSESWSGLSFAGNASPKNKLGLLQPAHCCRTTSLLTCRHVSSPHPPAWSPKFACGHN